MPRGKVVLVDDDPSVRTALRRLILAAGFEVESFADAVSYLAAPVVERPACLLLDIRMPLVNGLELQKATAGTAKALPIVFITGHGDEDVRAQALRSGAVAVLFKPVDETVLIAALEKALGSLT